MWIVFRYVKTDFQHLDKYVYGVVNDTDILTFQISMGEGIAYPINKDVFYLQDFFRSRDNTVYSVRRYTPFTPQYTGTELPLAQKLPDTQGASRSPVWALLNPCNILR